MGESRPIDAVPPRSRKKKRWTLGRYLLASGYLAAAVLPGGILLLPVLTWWHRRQLPDRTAKVRKPDPAKVAARWRRSRAALIAPRARRGSR
jgi:hypothetical protein